MPSLAGFAMAGSPSPFPNSADLRPTVAELYCRPRALRIEDFERTLLREALHPAARRFRFVLALLPAYFESDLRFLRFVGGLRRIEDLRYEEIDFNQDRTNRGLLRGKLRLRVSTRRVRQVVEATLGHTPHELSPRFPTFMLETSSVAPGP